jgi:hypothetical protein
MDGEKNHAADDEQKPRDLHNLPCLYTACRLEHGIYPTQHLVAGLFSLVKTLLLSDIIASGRVLIHK